MKTLYLLAFSLKLSLMIVLLFIFSTICSCQNNDTSSNTTLVQPVKDSLKLAIRHLYLDSNTLKRIFLNSYDARKFEDEINAYYKKQNYRYTWINKTGIIEQARNFLNILNQTKNDSFDTIVTIKKADQLISELGSEIGMPSTSDSLLSELELLLTASFFHYAHRNWGGVHTEDSKQVDWFINYHSLNYGSVLDSILKGKRAFEEEPIYRQYALLKSYIHYYDSIRNIGDWPTLNEGISNLKKGDTASNILNLKALLFLLKDLKYNNKTNKFDDSLEFAIKHFQKRNGYQEDEIVRGNTLNALKDPIDKYIKILLINMERCQWVPVAVKGDYIAVNIPAFKLYVYKDDKIAWSCKVVVGKESTSTAIFNDEIESIVFNPYWHIPKSIIQKETLPAIKSNSNYLVKHNMEVVNNKGKIIKASTIDWGKYNGYNFPYFIRQRPGYSNSLGKIKFLFPNSYDIYLHDTPAKSLFGENKRDFSHGCIRIEEPLKLAEYLLRNDTNYSAESIKRIIDNGKEKYVPLKPRIPIFIAYFTAWVDREGILNFRDDVYNHDEKMTKFLFN